MDKGARISGSTGNAYEYLGDDIGQFKVMHKNGTTSALPAKDILILASAILRPRLVGFVNEFADKLFKGLL